MILTFHELDVTDKKLVGQGQGSNLCITSADWAKSLLKLFYLSDLIMYPISSKQECCTRTNFKIKWELWHLFSGYFFNLVDKRKHRLTRRWVENYTSVNVRLFGILVYCEIPGNIGVRINKERGKKVTYVPVVAFSWVTRTRPSRWVRRPPGGIPFANRSLCEDYRTSSTW